MFTPCRSQQVFIKNVPDYSQPPLMTLPSTADVSNYCAPYAFLNIVEYWDVVKSHPFAYSLLAGMSGEEAAEYIGWFMDTNDQGSPARENGALRPAAEGTYVMDQWFGAEEFLLFDTNNSFLFPYSVPALKRQNGWDVQMIPVPDFPILKQELDDGNPAKVDFMYWNILASGAYIYDTLLTNDTIFIYEWGNVVTQSGTVDERDPSETWNLAEGENGIGHAVTAVGYLENYKQDTSYVIVHDNWTNTPKSIAVPWIDSKITTWFSYHLPDPPDLAVTNIRTAIDTSVGFTDSLLMNQPVTVAVTVHNHGAGAAAAFWSNVFVEFPIAPTFVEKAQHIRRLIDPVHSGNDSAIVYFDSLFTADVQGKYKITAQVKWDKNNDSLKNDPNDADLSNDTLIVEKWTALASDIKEPDLKIREFKLFQNYPNPFNPKTIIEYQLHKTSQVDLSIYNLLGQKVATLVSKKQPAGNYKIEWDASAFSSGIYFYRLETDKGFVKTNKLVLVK